MNIDMNSIISSIASLGGLGIVFGAGLAFASQKFAVEVDERVDQILEVLPGANCGGCGYPGCAAFANNVVEGNAPVNGCPVGGPSCADNVAKIMGVEAGSGVEQVAKVMCTGKLGVCKEEFTYHGIDTCVAANMIAGGSKACQYGCIGFGTCAEVCPFDAIDISEDFLAKVNPDKCVACGKCITACPKGIIQFVPKKQFVTVVCSNEDRGGHVKKNCEEACIACGMCERSCPFDAIHVVDNLARIDYDKCKNCLICVKKCPTKAIVSTKPERKKPAKPVVKGSGVTPPADGEKKLAPKPAAKPAEKAEAKPAAKPAEKAEAKPAEKPAEKVEAKPAEKTVEKTVSPALKEEAEKEAVKVDPSIIANNAESASGIQE